ncbi:DUF2513 domain-containing protein [Gemella sp. GH3]|uniref:DUF2513 domain-containing protein n=1 Tax=unclassified Gemella TaxID=2624949 RepID=UPI0015D00BA2|nr:MULTISPECIES: DUF2513 domain-containing protein [unclassified Gemella]MBF0714525.1 DUF2513 domain-containing protein [Gemella sp. GH3.1]NYS51477.1 DUF2513 domain-containing protein [Gemella sp. GH3]
MKLNFDLIRELLLECESKSNDSKLSQSEIDVFIRNNDYSLEEVAYHIQRLLEAGFVKGKVEILNGLIVIYRISCITWDGHHFLDTIRSEKVWDTAKKVSKELGIRSLSAFFQIATTTASQMITNYL